MHKVPRQMQFQRIEVSLHRYLEPALYPSLRPEFKASNQISDEVGSLIQTVAILRI